MPRSADDRLQRRAYASSFTFTYFGFLRKKKGEKNDRGCQKNYLSNFSSALTRNNTRMCTENIQGS